MTKIITCISRAALSAIAPLLALTLVGGSANAQAYRPVAGNAVKWMPVPPSIPAGAQIAVIMGDPTKAGPFVVRLRFPPGYMFPAHKHSVDELVTVLSGTIYAGKGDRLNRSKGSPLRAFGFNPQRANEAHYLWTTSGATIQIHGEGPFDFIYNNPADDRRKR